MTQRNRGMAMHSSMAEFAWILLFLSMGAAVVLLIHTEQLQKENLLFSERIRQLIQENALLKNELEDKVNGVTPCWMCPDSPIPAIAGTILIDSALRIRIQHFKGEETVIVCRPDETDSALFMNLKIALQSQFSGELKYAAGQNCYLRMRIVNHTERYSHYRNTAKVLQDLGIVVLQEEL